MKQSCKTVCEDILTNHEPNSQGIFGKINNVWKQLKNVCKIGDKRDKPYH